MVDNNKRPKGRPRKEGNLTLTADVVYTVERLRMSGIGRNNAIVQTVNEVKSRHPGNRLSATAVKNILAEWQPEGCFMFEVGAPGNWKPGVFRVKKIVQIAPDEIVAFNPGLAGQSITTYSLNFDERPNYQKRGRQITERKKFNFGRKKP